MVRLNQEIPEFVLEREGLFNRLLELAHHKDVNFKNHVDFSKTYLLHGPNEHLIREFFNENLISLLEKREVYHIESNGEALLIFKFGREARAKQAAEMLAFTEEVLDRIPVVSKPKS